MRTNPNSMRSKISAYLASVTDPLGTTYPDLMEAAGMDAEQLSRVIHCLRKTKDIHLINRGRHTRYFATAEARDAAAPAVNEFVDSLIKQVRAANDAKKAERYREKMAARPPKPPKAVKPPSPPRKVKASMPANVSIRSRTPQAAFKDQPAIIPPHVKVQVCPSGVDRRFTFTPPHKGWKGEITKAWIAERLERLK